jgi:CBS domain-containing protein
VATISQERSVVDAIALLKERGIGALVVTGATPPLVGIFSERDVVRALATNGEETLHQNVAELMSREVSVCSESTGLNDLMTMMTDRRIRHVPVVDDDRLSGLVSIGDVVKARLEELEHEKRDLLDYVSAR